VSLPNLVYFYRRRLRARLMQELFALIGIAVGVALLFAVQVSNTSLNASLAQLTHGIAGDAQWQIAARGPEGFDEHLLGRVGRLDGVRAVAPVLQAQANAVGPRGQRAVTLLASDPRLARLGGTLLSGYSAGRLANLRAVVLPVAVARTIGVRFGDSMTLQVNGRRVKVPVGAVVGVNDVGPLADSPTVVAPARYAQSLADMPHRLTSIFVLAEPGRTAAVGASLRRVAGSGLDVRPAGYSGRLFAQAALPNDRSTALFAGISALVGFLFAFNAMLLLARERRSVIGELRMSGFKVATIVEVLMFDAVLLGLLASIVGLALGDQLSRHVFQPTPGYLALAFPVGTARTVQLQTAVLAAASGTLAAVLATVSPLATLLTKRPIDAVEDDGLDQRAPRRFLHSGSLLAIGSGCLAVAVAILMLAPQAALFGMAALIASMLLTLPAILIASLGLVDRLRRRVRSVAPVIAVGEMLSASTRSVALAAIAAIAVFGSTAIEGAHRDLQRGLDQLVGELDAGTDVWVLGAGSANQLATTPFHAPDLGGIARVPGVSTVDVARGSFLDVGDRRVWVYAPPSSSPQPIPAGQLTDGDLDRATERIRGHGWAVVSESLAGREGLRVGQPFVLRAPRPTTFRVAAISTNLGWSPGAVVVNADDYRAAWGTTDPSALHIALEPGASPTRAAELIRRELGPASGLVVETAADRERQQRATSRSGLARLTQIATLVLIAAALAMAAAMGGMVWQRRQRLADLKLAGIDHRRLWRALLLESALLLGIGCSIGGVYGLCGEQLLDRALGTVTGFPVSYSFDVLVALVSLGTVTVVALGIAMVPGYLAARVPADVAFQD
jgi:putative ABC transport system permease protein